MSAMPDDILEGDVIHATGPKEGFLEIVVQSRIDGKPRVFSLGRYLDGRDRERFGDLALKAVIAALDEFTGKDDARPRT